MEICIIIYIKSDNTKYIYWNIEYLLKIICFFISIITNKLLNVIDKQWHKNKFPNIMFTVCSEKRIVT